MTAPGGARWPTRRITYFALMTSVAFVLSAAESMIPVPVPAPGIKLGLANIVTLLLLLDSQYPYYALVVTFARCVLAAAALGAMSTLLFSLAGGIFSCIIMWLLLRFNSPFSATGVSVAGAVAHNLAQLTAASFVSRDAAVFNYLPILLITGVAAGCATGFIALKVRGILKFIHK
ncbi:MAG: Gx transporter family protein [Oscillospiraceae bacterium]|nr:Gx transporter family protein [Oscillospiraceae bacterium]